MNTVLLGLSRYVMAILIAFYTFHCFMIFSCRSEKERSGYYFLQTVFLVLIHVSGFLVLSLRTGRQELLLLCALQEVLFIGLILLHRILYPEAGRLLINNLCLFLAVGFIILTRLSLDKAVRQFLIAAVSAVLTLGLPWAISRAETLPSFSWIFGGTGIAALSSVLIAGAVTNGSRLSFTLAGITFQPSEFVKLLFILFAAGVLSEYREASGGRGRELKNIRLALGGILAAAHVGILVLSRDLGGALIFFVVAAAMAYIALRKSTVILGSGILGILGALAGYRLFSHVRTRVLAWRDPFSYIEGQGYQITQSLFAIGTGGWFGMGLFMGSPDRIPVVERDFIFSAVSEELGCVFSLCLILILLSTFLFLMQTAMEAEELYFRLMGAGLAVNYMFQVFLAIGGVTKFIPLTGVTLPLVSYGGSSVLTTMCLFGMALGIRIRQAGKRKKAREEREPLPDRRRPEPEGSGRPAVPRRERRALS